MPTEKLKDLGEVHNRRGTSIRFKPDPQIFKSATFQPERLFGMTRAKAYLFGGVEIRWSAEPELVKGTEVPEKATFHYPGGLSEYLAAELGSERTVAPIFAGKTEKASGHGAVEWAVAWYPGDGFVRSYCNTIPTGDGGTHEAGLRNALTRGLKGYADLSGNKRAGVITADDVMTSAGAFLSVFIREPEFVGQTKDRLSTAEATRVVENAVRDPFDHWLAASPNDATQAPRMGDRARRGAAPPAPGKGNRPADRDAQASPPRQARRLLVEHEVGDRTLHRRGRFRRRLGQAGAQPRHAGDPAAARQDPQRRQRRPREAVAEPAAGRSPPGAGRRHPRSLPRRATSATTASSS